MMTSKITTAAILMFSGIALFIEALNTPGTQPVESFVSGFLTMYGLMELIFALV